MSITKAQAADLRPGDVVEVTSTDWPEGTVLRGPLYMPDGETLAVGKVVVRHWDGRHPFDTTLDLTVISRAPRPLYVNHDRTEPTPGDVVREADSSGRLTWTFADPEDLGNEWTINDRTAAGWSAWVGRADLPERLVLLVDGETGQVVQ